jgi:S-adenosylmethionine-diacylglycerol 3-amino-3-carboxypropyl transferase
VPLKQEAAMAMSLAHDRHAAIRQAVHRHEEYSRQGLLERAFTFAFRGLVYAQIWEDPLVDLEALQLGPDSHLVTIASGGCNVLSYLTANPCRITAVDLNTAHVALNRLKLVAARRLPDHASFYRFFGEANQPDNVMAYREFVAPYLDETSRRYWEGRDLLGRKRIGGFARNIYRRGLLGHFIGGTQLLARCYGIRSGDILAANSIDEQREIFETRFAPIFEKRFVRWLASNPASLFGLGIPPAQYKALLGDESGGMVKVLRDRLEKLACGFDISQNYFAWQAFGRGYEDRPRASVPPYLEEAHYPAIVERVDRVEIRHMNFIDYLRECPLASRDRYVLLDAQDWMTDAQLGELWFQITRTARPGARVIFRTAAAPTLLPGRVPEATLSRWRYEEAASLDFTRRDRSSIYGGMHLYTYAGA